jgi:hypothetical protein
VGGWEEVLNRPHGGLDTHGSADPENKKARSAAAASRVR